ncbi:Rieske (2Fe-2S) protein [Nonomuraea monospora]
MSGQECQAPRVVTDDQRAQQPATDAAAGASRRATLLGAGGAGLMTVLAACAGTGHTGTGHFSAETGEPSGGTTTPAATRSGAGLARTSDIPEGGGKVFPDQKIVVVQPTAGKFRAFSAVCTHQSCTIDDVSSGMINCPCHGSMFWLDGKVMGGPATRPLPEVEIKIDGDTISLA